VTEGGSAYLTLSADNSWLGLPGARLVDPSIGVDQLATDRRGATTPFDYAAKRGANATAGIARMLTPGVELIVDGGVRSKQETAEYHGDINPSSSVPLRAVDTRLTTTSLTPRVRVDTLLAGLPFKGLGGVDYIRAQYDSERPLLLGAPPIHRYDLAQSSLAAYWQHTVSLLPGTDLGAGLRVQRTAIRARDTFDADAPGGSFCFPPFGCFPADVQGIPLDRSESNHAYHLGFEHRFNPALAVFGRHARSFRVPNVDERVGMVTPGGPEPTNFDLRTQTSHDWELGARLRTGALELQWSAYDMYLVNEIHFRFAPNFIASNINLDPTRRYGHETIAGYRLNDRVRFKGGLAYTRAVFREGPFAGNDIPLVSRWTGSVGVAWDIAPRRLSLDGVVRYVGERRMDNDQRNLQPLVPAHAVVDIGFSGEIDRFYWSFKVQNLLDSDYFDYAIASPFPDGPGSKLNRFNAYPQPGRTFVFKAGAGF
jgi:iron complex outermembrane receptor protein